MFPLDSRLYWRVGDTVKYFDPDETASLIDDNEVAGAGFTCSWRSHAMRGNPDYLKRLQYVDCDQNGTIDMTINIDPTNQGELLAGPTITGMTYNNRKVAMPDQFHSVELVITSNTEALHEVREIGLAYNTLKRYSGS